MCVSGDQKFSFFGKFGVLCFLETPVLRFALLPYYRQFIVPIIQVPIFILFVSALVLFESVFVDLFEGQFSVWAFVTHIRLIYFPILPKISEDQSSFRNFNVVVQFLSSNVIVGCFVFTKVYVKYMLPNHYNYNCHYCHCFFRWIQQISPEIIFVPRMPQNQQKNWTLYHWPLVLHTLLSL